MPLGFQEFQHLDRFLDRGPTRCGTKQESVDRRQTPVKLKVPDTFI
jgi:hypothetical protein